MKFLSCRETLLGTLRLEIFPLDELKEQLSSLKMNWIVFLKYVSERRSRFGQNDDDGAALGTQLGFESIKSRLLYRRKRDTG